MDGSGDIGCVFCITGPIIDIATSTSARLGRRGLGRRRRRHFYSFFPSVEWTYFFLSLYSTFSAGFLVD